MKIINFLDSVDRNILNVSISVIKPKIKYVLHVVRYCLRPGIEQPSLGPVHHNHYGLRLNPGLLDWSQAS